MPLSKAKLKRWGPKALRELTDQIEKEINDRSPIPGLGIYINETPNGRQISTHPPAGAKTQSLGGAAVHPFQVSAAIKNSFTAIQVYPGLILNQTPYIDGELMNKLVFDGQGNLVPNTFTPPSVNFSVWLITRIKNEFDNYHPRIDIAQPGEEGYVPVLPPEQSCYITATAPAEADRIDFRIKWDDGSSREAGGFPIRIADVKMEAAAEGVTTGPTVKSITQYVFNSWRSLILSDNDIIPISF